MGGVRRPRVAGRARRNPKHAAPAAVPAAAAADDDDARSGGGPLPAPLRLQPGRPALPPAATRGAPRARPRVSTAGCAQGGSPRTAWPRDGANPRGLEAGGEPGSVSGAVRVFWQPAKGAVAVQLWELAGFILLLWQKLACVFRNQPE